MQEVQQTASSSSLSRPQTPLPLSLNPLSLSLSPLLRSLITEDKYKKKQQQSNQKTNKPKTKTANSSPLLLHPTAFGCRTGGRASRCHTKGQLINQSSGPRNQYIALLYSLEWPPSCRPHEASWTDETFVPKVLVSSGVEH